MNRIVFLLSVLILIAIAMDVSSCAEEQDRNKQKEWEESLHFNMGLFDEMNGVMIYSKYDAEEINNYCRKGISPCYGDRTLVLMKFHTSLYNRYAIPNSMEYIDTTPGTLIFIALIDQEYYREFVDRFDRSKSMRSSFTLTRTSGHYSCDAIGGGNGLGCAIRSYFN